MHCRQKAQREIYPWKVATTRDKGTGGATAPKHRGGKHHKGGNSPRGNPARQQFGSAVLREVARHCCQLQEKGVGGAFRAWSGYD